MRRLAIIFVVLTGAAVLGMLLFRARHERTGLREFTLRDGTVMRVEGITWGTNQFLSLPPAWLRRLVSRVPPAWLRPASLPPAYLSATMPARRVWGDGAHLWLRRYDPTKDAYLDCNIGELIAFDSAGMAFGSVGSTGFDSGRASQANEFEAMDWRAARLRFQLKVGQDAYAFSLSNPRRGERFPEWQALPLPQNVASGPFTLTLSEVKRASSDYARWNPQVTITRDGEDVSLWFNQNRQFVDPTGNRYWERLSASEPVWGLEVAAEPSARFPFDESQGVRLGRFTVPEPGKVSVVPTTSQLTNACLHWAAALGSGHFVFLDGTNMVASPQPAHSGNSSEVSKSWRISLGVGSPTLLVVLRGPVAGGRILPAENATLQRVIVRGRRMDGTFVAGECRDSSNSSDGHTVTRLLPFQFPTLQPGELLDAEIFLTEPLRARFSFAAPGKD